MRVIHILAATAMVLPVAGFAQTAPSAQSVFPRGIQSFPTTSDARVETMMRGMDRFMARQKRQEQGERYYADGTRLRDDRYAERSSDMLPR